MTPQEALFHHQATEKAGDLVHRLKLQKALTTYATAVERAKQRFVDWEQARQHAARIKWDAINHLDQYLEQFEALFTARGGVVHWAETAEQACQIVLDLVRQYEVRKVVKSKSMTTEEIGLNEALEGAGVEVRETDLGEFIVQLAGEKPYHIVTPAMHKSVAEISHLFHQKLSVPETENAEALTRAAREKLREDYLTAEMGITGANFAVADVGLISVIENEGNARLTLSLPPVHVAVVGLEKVIPRLEDLALFWPLLAASGTGQHLTCYDSLIAGPRQPGELDGPEACHVIFLDNGRTQLLANLEQREALHCIRCGACINACPVFANIGGHAYGTTYQGPIGSVITPRLGSLARWKHLPYASSLCGACSEVCPVHIEIHRHLLENRRDAVGAKYTRPWERWSFKLWAWVMRRRWRMDMVARMFRALQRAPARLGLEGTRLDPLASWTRTRDFPPLARESFRHYWETHEQPS